MEPVRDREWRPRGGTSARDKSEAFASELGISPLLAQLLCLRGISDVAAAEHFLNGNLSALPDPATLHGIDAGVRRLVDAITGQEKILIHGDYDVDGISGTALLVEFLSGLGAEVGYHIPLRLKDGYGLSAQAIDKAAAQGVNVIVSVDCGVTAVDEAELAGSYGIDLVITDHHQPPEQLPAAHAIINPHQPGCEFPDKNLSGVGVAFFLAVALRKALRESGWFHEEKPEPDLRHLLDLVALGTVADVVPLVGVNRLLVRSGLKVLNNGARVGVKALLAVAGISDVKAGDVGFKLGPRLNAAGRIEDAALGVSLLLSGDRDEAAEIAGLLDDFNRERQNIEARTLSQAEDALAVLDNNRRSIVLADEDWHPGVIGIVASRLVERYYRPTFLLALENGEGKGSGRSTRDINLYEALQACSACLKGYGGHAAAAGLTLDRDAVDLFVEKFEAAVSAQQAVASTQFMEHDGELLLEELTVPAVEELSVVEPFGMGNPAPQFVVRSVDILGARIVGEKHLKFSARQGGYSLSCIAFGMAERIDELEGTVDILFVPEINRWQGRSDVQLRVRDFRRAVTSEE